MPTIFTEATFEQAVIELFESMGYTHLYALNLERDYADPLLGDALRETLARINPGLPEDAVEEALGKVRNLDAGSLAQKNQRFTDYLQNGVPVKYFVQGEERSALVRLVDYLHPQQNTFYVVNSLRVGYNEYRSGSVQ